MYFAYDILISIFITVPQFAVRESRSLEGTPTIDVTFDDGYTDTFVLDNFYFAEEDKLARKENCDYIGHLAGDLNTCVAVTGCAGSEDLEITIIGERGGLYRMDLNGLVSLVEPDFDRVRISSFTYLANCR